MKNSDQKLRNWFQNEKKLAVVLWIVLSFWLANLLNGIVESLIDSSILNTVIGTGTIFLTCLFAASRFENKQ
ncbi:hypothetical protein [Vagococcus zengguangii]|uniref:Uncharacterized protein n=1 Tax=Vagococcus zengguangii TaxID=2571750 RepID=A0A4D7CV40_9ENTE|nr:hypothetical protein [Vagococcus zengguangii]QCI87303.1 hypothetical protein FA707_10395 [Vagococcus zengguangii]TLG79982.1 hypothetical protein FE258_06525 [Vagococcus zengguangii]